MMKIRERERHAIAMAKLWVFRSPSKRSLVRAPVTKSRWRLGEKKRTASTMKASAVIRTVQTKQSSQSFFECRAIWAFSPAWRVARMPIVRMNRLAARPRHVSNFRCQAAYLPRQFKGGGSC